MLEFFCHVKTVNARYPDDQRIKCIMTLTEYKDEDGNIYRKSFYTKNGNKPIIPQKATHDELIELKKQF